MRATRRSCASGVTTIGLAPMAATRLFIRSKAPSGVVFNAHRKYGESLKRPALAASGPDCSSPAIGCPPTNGIARRSALLQLAAFVRPTSVTSDEADLN